MCLYWSLDNVWFIELFIVREFLIIMAASVKVCGVNIISNIMSLCKIVHEEN